MKVLEEVHSGPANMNYGPGNLDLGPGNLSMGYMKWLVSHWKMEEIDPLDIGWPGHHNDGTGTGLVAATDIVDGIAGGRATEYNGADEYSALGPNDMMNGLEAVSMSCWVKVNAPIDNAGILLSRGSTFHGLNVGSGAGALDVQFRVNNITVGTTSLILGQWHHLVGTWTRGGLNTLYRDGAFVVSGAGSANPITHDDFLYAAWDDIAGDRRFSGVIDEVMIFNAALTLEHITDLYNRQLRGRI